MRRQQQLLLLMQQQQVQPWEQQQAEAVGNSTRPAPSQPAAPSKAVPTPDYPFQQVVSDYFHYAGKEYLLVVDRYSGWPVVGLLNLCYCGTGSFISSGQKLHFSLTLFRQSPVIYQQISMKRWEAMKTLKPC